MSRSARSVLISSLRDLHPALLRQVAARAGYLLPDLLPRVLQLYADARVDPWAPASDGGAVGRLWRGTPFHPRAITVEGGAVAVTTRAYRTDCGSRVVVTPSGRTLIDFDWFEEPSSSSGSGHACIECRDPEFEQGQPPRLTWTCAACGGGTALLSVDDDEPTT